jgi:hypothetical protein
VQKKLPSDVRRELETRLELDLDISQESVKRKAIEILESLQRKTLEGFLRSEGFLGQVCSSPSDPSMPTLIPDPGSGVGNDRDMLERMGLDAVSLEAPVIPLNDARFDPNRDIFTNERLNGPKEVHELSALTWNEEIILSENARSRVRNPEALAVSKPYAFPVTGLPGESGTNLIGLPETNEDFMYWPLMDIFPDNMME